MRHRIRPHPGGNSSIHFRRSPGPLFSKTLTQEKSHGTEVVTTQPGVAFEKDRDPRERRVSSVRTATRQTDTPTGPKGSTIRTDHPASRTAKNCASWGHNDLRDGATRRISAPLLSYGAVCGLGCRRSRGVDRGAPPRFRCFSDQASSLPRRAAAEESAGEIVTSGEIDRMDGGKRVDAWLPPLVQASIMSAHSCNMWRRCCSYSALL